MKLAFRILMVAGLMALGYWGWAVIFPNPRTVVRHRMEKLARLASFAPNEGTIATLASLERLSGFFSPRVEVNVQVFGGENYTFNSRDELMLAAQAARVKVNGVKVKFTDMNIEMTAGNREALVDLGLRADVGGEKDSVVEELKFNLKIIDGDWLITRVESVK